MTVPFPIVGTKIKNKPSIILFAQTIVWNLIIVYIHDWRTSEAPDLATVIIVANLSHGSHSNIFLLLDMYVR